MNFKKFISFGFSIIFSVSCLNFTEKIYAMDSNNKYNENLSCYDYYDCFQKCDSKYLHELFTNKARFPINYMACTSDYKDYNINLDIKKIQMLLDARDSKSFQKLVKFMKKVVFKNFKNYRFDNIFDYVESLPSDMSCEFKKLQDSKRYLIDKKRSLGGFYNIYWLAFLSDDFLFNLSEDNIRKYLNSTEPCCLKDRWDNGKVYSLCEACANQKILNGLPYDAKHSIRYKNKWEFAECRCSMCEKSYPLYEIGFCPNCYKSFCERCYKSKNISKTGCPNCKFKCEDIHKYSNDNPFRFEVSKNSWKAFPIDKLSFRDELLKVRDKHLKEVKEVGEKLLHAGDFYTKLSQWAKKK